jgi:hypothetical protein
MSTIHPHPQISLQQLKDSDRALILRHARKGLVQGILFFLVPFLLFISVVIYINLHWMALGMKNDDARGYLNVALVLLAILPVRLFASRLIAYLKESKGWQKKIVRGIIHGQQEHTVFIGKLKLALPPELATGLQVDDTIEAELSAVSGLVFKVTRITAEQAEEIAVDAPQDSPA